MGEFERLLGLIPVEAIASSPFALLAACLVGVCAIALAARWLTRRGARRGQGAPLILDGSNILYWKDKTPKLEPLREAIRMLRSRGYAPGVVFDANAGYLVAGGYLHHDGFAKLLGLPSDNVMVVPKGEPADVFILNAARQLGARIVTNDRYRDWADRYPEVATPGYLIKGGYGENGLWLDLPAAAEKSAAA
ncbi:MAG: hypothetical protein AAFN79_14880 [Pseudomonadota bacterium]